MKYLTSQEIDCVATDYICFKKLIDDSDSEELRYIFKGFQNRCIEKLESLVTTKVGKYRKFSNYLDLKQDGLEALLAALGTYKPEKGCFKWWADRYIKTRISRSANAHSTIRYPMSKAKQNTPYKTNNIPVIIDISSSPLSEVETSSINAHLHKAINTLSEEHKTIVTMTYGLEGVRPQSVKNILELLHITRAKYVKLLKESRNKVKGYFVRLERGIDG
jgi:RNA polymerase sigma factor (sigma-70 family)